MKSKRMFIVAAICIMIGLGVTAPPVESEAKTTIKYYCIAPPFSPINVAVEKVKEFLVKESDGQVQMEMYPSGQLGPESTGLNNLQMNVVQTAALTGVAISVIEPKANILMMPFVFRDWEDVERFATGPVVAELAKSLEARGLKMLGVGSYGFFNTLSKDRFLKSPQDFRGVKIRVFPTPVLLDLYRSLGASPTPIAFPEIYTALQQGVIDATDGTLDSSHASRQFEVAKYLTRTDHIHGWFFLLANKRWFDGLPEKTQDLVRAGFEKYAPSARQLSKEYDEKILAVYEEEGVKIETLSDTEREALVKATREIHKKYHDIVGGDFMDNFYGELDFQLP